MTEQTAHLLIAFGLGFLTGWVLLVLSLPKRRMPKNPPSEGD